MALRPTPLPKPSAPLIHRNVTASLLEWVRHFLRAAHQFKPLDSDAFEAFILAYCCSLAPATLDQYIWFMCKLEGIMGALFADWVALHEGTLFLLPQALLACPLAPATVQAYLSAIGIFSE